MIDPLRRFASQLRPTLAPVSLVLVFSLFVGVVPPLHADETADEIELIKQQLLLLQQRLEKLEAKQNSQAAESSQPEGSSQKKSATTSEPAQEPDSLAARLAGAKLGVSFVAVGQHAHDAPLAAGQSNTEINYRGDFELGLPLGSFDNGNTQGQLYTQLRVGQGDAVNVGVNTFSGTVNSSTFALAGSPADASTVLLAQMWYQVQSNVDWLGNHGGGQGDQFSLTVGKIDPFVFFDTNPVADDESEYFLNNVFVHNAQLDSGGDIGADQYGFSPGLVLEYALRADSSSQWTGRFGMFGAGNGSSFDDSLSRPFSIAQLSYEGKALGDFDGFYSFYAWNNPQSTDAFTNATERHTGFGLSIWQ